MTPASRRLTRRMFLADAGRGAFAIAVLGVAGCSLAGQATPQLSASARAAEWHRLPFGIDAFVAAYLLVRAGEAVVVDTGSGTGPPGSDSEGVIHAALDAAGLGWTDVGHVILTHWHQDHTGGLADVLAAAPEARAYAGAADIPRIIAPRPVGQSVDPSRLTPVQDGERVFGLRIVTTPGHTPGHIAVLDEELRVLVAGDALTTNGGRPTAPSGWSSDDLAEAMRSVAKLAALDFETLFVGHGGPIEAAAAARVREFLDQCPIERLMGSGSTACWNPTFALVPPSSTQIPLPAPT